MVVHGTFLVSLEQICRYFLKSLDSPMEANHGLRIQSQAFEQTNTSEGTAKCCDKNDKLTSPVIERSKCARLNGLYVKPFTRNYEAILVEIDNLKGFLYESRVRIFAG